MIYKFCLRFKIRKYLYSAWILYNLSSLRTLQVRYKIHQAQVNRSESWHLFHNPTQGKRWRYGREEEKENQNKGHRYQNI